VKKEELPPSPGEPRKPTQAERLEVARAYLQEAERYIRIATILVLNFERDFPVVRAP